MKRLNILVLALMLFFIAGCSNNNFQNNEEDKLQVKNYISENLENKSIEVNTDLFEKEIGGYKLVSARPVVKKEGGIVYLIYSKENSDNVSVNLIFSKNSTVKNILRQNIEKSGYLVSDEENKYIFLYNGVSWFTNNQFDIVSISMDVNYSDINSAKSQIKSNEFYKVFNQEFTVDNNAYNTSNNISYSKFYSKSLTYKKNLENN